MISPGERKLTSCIAFSMRLAKKLDLIHVRRQLSGTLASLTRPQCMGASKFPVPEVCEMSSQTLEDIITRPVCEKMMMQLQDRAESIILRLQQAVTQQQDIIDQLRAEVRDAARPDGDEARARCEVQMQSTSDLGVEEGCSMQNQAHSSPLHLLREQHRAARIAAKQARREERQERCQQQQAQEPLPCRARVTARSMSGDLM
mmetsp:Transcript_7159/g.16548  ORF Transcript_7159/g.16548 Transcript_7159/m.16548 type:complete len:202 (+) Transcript_7159:107-712(+)